MLYKPISTNQHGNLVMLDDSGRVRSRITSIVCQIHRFDFDCNLVVTRKLIIRTPPGLGRKPLYSSGTKKIDWTGSARQSFHYFLIRITGKSSYAVDKTGLGTCVFQSARRIAFLVITMYTKPVKTAFQYIE